MYYGVSWYPEHKTREELGEDLDLLTRSGINTVRMGEFAWCRMEPEEGRFDFDWLEEAVEKLGKGGINSILCTSTACPPAWLVSKHPEILYVDNRGVKRPFGGRRFTCCNNPVYREYCGKITQELGRRFGANPYVSGFQIDNELAQEASGRCHCPVCQEKFREWLREKYGTVEEFNKRSGAIFWGGEYDSFDQISIPVNTIEPGGIQAVPMFYENPTLRLDFEHFASDSLISFQKVQEEILHRYTSVPVTTNATGLATNSLDYYKSSRDLDCYGFDYYPSLRDSRVDSFPYAFARGIKEGKPFQVLEFVSGGGHRLGGSGRLQPNPGAMKQAAVQALAHGAGMLLHFQFRTFPFGAEQLNYAIVDMDGVPRRRYFEMQETAALLKRLEPFEKAGFDNQIGICLDYSSHWALRIKPVNESFSYLDYAGRIYRILEERGYNADVTGLDADFSRYRVLILPACIVLGEEKREKLRTFVREGGILLGTFLTSVKNEDNVGYRESLPAGLTDVFGVTVEEVEPVQEKNREQVRIKLGNKEKLCKDGLWSDLLQGFANPLGVYETGYKKGSMVVSENSFGDGWAYYLGTDLEEEVLGDLLSYLCGKAGLISSPVVPDKDLEVVHRVLEGEDCWFVFNFTGLEREAFIKVPLEDLLEGCVYEGEIPLKPHGFALVRSPGSMGGMEKRMQKPFPSLPGEG